MTEPDEDLWERNAGWWQEGFTEGADEEYTEQILPMAVSHLAGAQRVLDVGCGEGQVARLAVAAPAPASRGRAGSGPPATWCSVSAERCASPTCSAACACRRASASP